MQATDVPGRRPRFARPSAGNPPIELVTAEPKQTTRPPSMRDRLEMDARRSFHPSASLFSTRSAASKPTLSNWRRHEQRPADKLTPIGIKTGAGTNNDGVRRSRPSDRGRRGDSRPYRDPLPARFAHRTVAGRERTPSMGESSGRAMPKTGVRGGGRSRLKRICGSVDSQRSTLIMAYGLGDEKCRYRL